MMVRCFVLLLFFAGLAQMNYSDKISNSVQKAMEEKAVQHRTRHNRNLQPQ